MRKQVEEVSDIELYEFELEGGDQTLASARSILEQKIEEAEKYLSKEEERELVRRYQEFGDEEAFQNLIDTHQGYLKDIVKRYHKLTGVDEEELDQQARLGFVKGVKKFDLQKYDTKVLTYVGNWVLAEVQRHATLNRTIQGRPSNVSVKNRELFKRHKKLMDEHWKSCGAEPLTPSQQDEFERKLGCTLGEFEELRALYFAPGVSLNRYLSRDVDQKATFLDMLRDERESPLDKLDRQYDVQYLLRIMSAANNLTPNESFLIQTVHLEERDDGEVTLAQVGAMLGVTRERARQIEASAFYKMREAVMNNPDLRQAAIDWSRRSIERLEKAGYGGKMTGVSGAFRSRSAKNPPAKYLVLDAAFKKVCEEECGGMTTVDGHNGYAHEMAYD